MDSFTVTNVLEYNDNEIRPILGEFQNGQLNNTSVHHEIFNELKKTFIKVNTKMSYKGTVKRDPFSNNYLALVRNGEATLVPTDYALLAPDIEEQEESEKEDTDYYSALRTLQKEFGSKRTKIMAQQEERMRLNTKNTTKSLEEAVVEMDLDENDLETTTDTTEATYIPMINRDADRVQDVYSLSNLIPNEVLNSLDENVLNDDIYSIIHTDLVRNQMEKKTQLNMTEEIEKQCKILLVVDCILNFLTVPLRVVSSKKYKPCQYSEQLSKYVLDTFTLPGKTGRNRSSSMKDKAMCYCVVLTALVNNFEVNLEELCKALKVKITKLQNIAKLLAFVPVNAKDKTNVVLKLPLPPPVKNLAHTPKRKR